MKEKRIEKIKTIVIAVLVTGIVAFLAGNRYGHNQANAVSKAAKTVQTVSPK